jgi:hypothetical protein
MVKTVGFGDQGRVAQHSSCTALPQRPSFKAVVATCDITSLIAQLTMAPRGLHERSGGADRLRIRTSYSTKLVHVRLEPKSFSFQVILERGIIVYKLTMAPRCRGLQTAMVEP